MGPRNFLNLRLQSNASSSSSTQKDSTELEEGPSELEVGQQEAAAVLGDSETHRQPERPGHKKRRERSYNFGRIPKLLMLGYASEESQRRYEKGRDWKRLYTILMFKIENITIVSGLLLASSCNLLIAGDLRRMTHAAVSASMFGSILSIVFGLLCRINITSGRLEFLVTRTRLFYYLYSTPSLWGGAAALAFFAAVCAYTWLEEETKQYGWEARAGAVVLSGMLIGNACACFVLGAGVMQMQAEGAGEKIEEEEKKKEKEKEGKRKEDKEEDGGDEMDRRNRRARMQSHDTTTTSTSTSTTTIGGIPGFSSFGIQTWGGAARQWDSRDDLASPPSLRRPTPTRAATIDSSPDSLHKKRHHVRRQYSKW